jgi:hypothetical protein
VVFVVCCVLCVVCCVLCVVCCVLCVMCCGTSSLFFTVHTSLELYMGTERNLPKKSVGLKDGVEG